MKNYLQGHNQVKIASETNNDTIFAFLNHQLTPEQMGLLLEGNEHLQTKENIKLVEESVIKESYHLIERLKQKLMDIQSIRSTFHSIRRAHS